ncbi:glycosyltransferase family 4 protein [Peribacillus simplex]
MKKVLFTATVDSHIINFHIPYLKFFKERGYEVHVASNGNSDIPYTDVKHNISFQRSPFKMENILAYSALKKIIELNNFKIIHCNSPVGSVVTRLAARNKRKNDAKVIYTAHGFHFYKGAAITNWLLFYPIERWLSKYTNCIITINEEDYQNTIKYNFKSEAIELVYGVGVDLNRFSPSTDEEKKALRKKYSFNEEDFILMYTAELNKNKQQDLLINGMSILKNKIPNIKLLLAGEGVLEEQYKEQVKRLGLNERVCFLGYRKDIHNLLKLSDVAVSASRREGLPLNIMEAMASGLPLVVTNCRGNRDLVRDGENGYVIGIDDIEGLINAIDILYNSEELKNKFRKNNIEIVEKYSIEKIMKKMENTYSKYF